MAEDLSHDSVRAPANAGVHSVSFPHTSAGDGANARFILECAPAIRRVVWRERFAGVLAVAVMLPLPWWMVYSIAQREVRESAAILATIVTVLLGVLMSMWVTSSGTWGRFHASMKGMVRMPPSTTPGVQITAEVGPRGVRWSHSDQAVEYGWSFFDRVDVVDNFIVLQYASASSGISIPRERFATPAESDEFVRHCRGLLEASGNSILSRHREKFESGKVHCAACGYPLKGLSEPRCPECGLVVVGLALTCEEMLSYPMWKLVWKSLWPQQPASNRVKK